MKILPSLNYIPESRRTLACAGEGCFELAGDGWKDGPSFVHGRYSQTSAVTSRGLLIVGGGAKNGPYDTELIPAMGGDGVESFSLPYWTKFHCMIQVSESEIVLAGTYHAPNLVTKYSGIDGDNVVSEELPPLVTGRYRHACGTYWADKTQVGFHTRLIPLLRC